MINNQIDYNKLDLDPDVLGKAQNGDDVAQLKIGKALFNDGSYTKAINWILESAEQGNMEAQFRLADLYALGQGTEKSQEDAYHWYTKAALQGYKKALIRIHNLYQEDKKMYCRGQLDSNEKEWADEEFKKEHNIRELNEYRRKQQAPILNNAVDYYTEQFKYYKSPKEENIESDLNLAFLYQYGYGTRKNMILAFDFYKKAAEQKHRDAQYNLAYLYQTNTDIKLNYRLALRWYRVSATNGNIAAQNCLAYFYEKGLATEPSNEGALYWYTKAAISGNSSAQLTLGRLYRKGQGVEKNISEAIKWYKLAANQGNNAARNCLNQLRLTEKIPSSSVSQPVVFTLRSKLHKDIIDLNESVHIKKLKILAQHVFMTDGNAMFQIGLKYYKGEDLPQDKDIGFQWIKKAAKAGMKDAELKIARMYENGDTVDQDYHKSSIWTLRSVKKRNNTALLKLGILYKNGLGVRKDPLEASKWFIISANRGNTHGQFQFGLLRYYGEGVRQDKKEALEFFTETALLGDAGALYQLGSMYEIDDFGERDIRKEIKAHKSTLTVEEYKAAEIIKMYELSGSLGNQNAHFRLARIYEKGELMKKDLVKAQEHYTITANSGNPYYQAELALKYINGDFEDALYIKAFDLFQKAAAKKEPRALSVFQIPIEPNDNINDYSKVIQMFILASTRGVNGIQFNIGHAYEHGIQPKGKNSFSRDYKQSIFWYFLASGMGDSRAAYRIDIIHEKEESTEKYQGMVFRSYSRAFENGNSDFAYYLGLIYLRGERVTQDFIKAFNLFTAASNMGHKEAREKLALSKNSENFEMLEAVANYGNVAIQYQLGIYFENRDDSKSIKWLMLAAEGGLNDAYYRLGVLHADGRNNYSYYLNANALYKKAIEKDHEDALYRLAQIYHYGKGIERDYLKAYELYRRAANIGHIGALKVLNLNEKRNTFSREKLTEESQVFSPDELTSIILMLEFVAEQGNIDLQFELGYFYENSEDNQNCSKALKWYTMATAARHTEAIYRLGLLYENGLGVIQDYSKSLQLYNKAKDQGSHYALYRLGILFHHGSGVDKSPTKAVDCYTKAAKLGNRKSQYALGRLYEKGELVQKDLIKALILYTDAYMNGNIDVIPDLYNLYGDQSYEYFSCQRLSQILTKFERIGSANNNTFQNIYGYMYYSLGRMYLEGIETIKNNVEALKRFLIAENQYGYSDAKPFTRLIYDDKSDEKNTYIQRMQAYFDIKDTLSSEQQYKIGMIHYNDAKCFYEEDSTNKNNSTPLLTASKNDETAFQYMLLASKNNHTKAQYQLGTMYLLGYGVLQDEDQASVWIEKYVEAIKPKQCYKLGLDFYNGSGVSQNYKIASIFVLKAIKEDNHEAQYLLGLMYLHGLGVNKNFEKATKWLRKSIPKSNKEECYEKGMGFYRDTKVDHRISFAYIKKAAEENHSEAQVQLGVMHYYGHGVEQNYAKAMNCFKQSMKEMDPYRCFNQGMKFYQGIEVEKDYKIALIYIKEAAGKNHKDARAQLDNMYLYGHGIEEVMEYFQQSMKEMDPYRCYNQGMKYYQGIEVGKNYEIAFFYIKNAAEKNYRDAQAQLSIMYLHGHGVEQNQNEAMNWIQQSIGEWGAYNCYKQGMKFYQGVDVEKNCDIALIYIKEAAENNHSEAQAQLGDMYLQGHGVERNHKEAMNWFQQSTRGWDTNSCFKQGMKFYNGYGAVKNYEIALIYIKEAAENNHSEAQAQLGDMYLHGHGVEQNHEESKKWLHESMKEADSYRCYKKGMKFYQGTEVEKDYEIALLCIKTAAEENYRAAQAQLAIMYLQGHGVEQNYEEAMNWIQQSTRGWGAYNCYKQGMKFYQGVDVEKNYGIALIYIKEAAENNHSEAQAQLGDMYLQGHGVERNHEEAINWFQQSITEWNKDRCYEGGMKFYEGNGVEQNYEIALFYIKKAAEKNNRKAKAQLGSMYFYGHGVNQNEEEAMKWIQQSIIEMREFECYTQAMKFYQDSKADKRYKIVLPYLKKALEKNHCEAQAQLGIMHFHGYGIEQNREKAIQLLEESAKKMVGCDLYRLGMKCYNNSEIDDAIALFYLEKAAKDNYEDARAQLGLMYSNGRGVEKNLNKAMEWIESSVKNMMPHRCYNHGIQFFNFNKIDQHYRFSLIYFRKAAEKNHLYSQAQLGCMYLNGYGVKQDSDEASQWYSKAIREDSDQPIYKIGQIYHYNNGGIQDFSKAFEFYHRKLGDADKGFALHGIGLLYEYGDGVSQDYEKASKYYRQSTESSNIGGYFSLGLLFYSGRGVNQEYDTAYLLFTKVVKIASNSEEMYVFIENVNAGSKNAATSSTHYNHSLVTSDRICGEAHYYMGLMCENGQGRHKNEKEARMHFEEAFERGVQRAEFFLK